MSATESIVALRSIIKKSKYTTMFRFEVYENWIKEQITHPLGEILRLLEVNKETLMSAKQDLESQIQSLENDSQFIPNLKLALTRVEMQIGEIDTFIPELKTTLKKLQ